MTHSKVRLAGYASFFIFAILLAACSQSNSEPQPPDMAYGRDLCEACGMIISEAKFAAATVTIDGKPHKFDDAGEMFTFHTKHTELQVRAWFVHDYNSQKWIPAPTAFYVMSKEIQSPMGAGIAAFADKSTAETFAARFNVKVLTFDEVRVAKY